MKRVFLLVLLIVSLISCEKEVDKLSNEIDLSNMELNLDISFSKTYKVNNINDVNKILDKYLNNMYSITSKNNQDTDPIDGFEAEFDGENLTIIGIEPNASACPDGWINRGTCSSQECVADKVSFALAEHVGQSGCGMVRVEKGSLGLDARVCSKGC